MEQITIQFNLNGHDVTADPNKRLVDFLREDMGMTSVRAAVRAKCGACTIIYSGKAVTSLPDAGRTGGRSPTVTLKAFQKTASSTISSRSVCGRGRRAVRLLHARHGPLRQGPSGQKPDANEEIQAAPCPATCAAAGYMPRSSRPWRWPAMRKEASRNEKQKPL